jgi:hypothetical protein
VVNVDNFYEVLDIFKNISDLEKDKIAFVKNCNLTINEYKLKIMDITSEANIQYDFYHSYKHYINLNKDPNYFNLYYKINNKYMPIVTDICLSGDDITKNSYDDYIKITTGTLNNLTIYCDSSNVENFPKNDLIHIKN